MFHRASSIESTNQRINESRINESTFSVLYSNFPVPPLGVRGTFSVDGSRLSGSSSAVQYRISNPNSRIFKMYNVY